MRVLGITLLGAVGALAQCSPGTRVVDAEGVTLSTLAALDGLQLAKSTIAPGATSCIGNEVAYSSGELYLCLGGRYSVLNSVPLLGCGNGILNAGELCDDGNDNDDDICGNDCTRRCGDGVAEGAEECDDGNDVDDDVCHNDCTLTCGDGVTAGSEECDDGNDDDGDLCHNDCTLACGDGFFDTDTEECDDDNDVDDDLCSNDCTLTCGDGVLDADTEDCDDGNFDNFDKCSDSTGTCTHTILDVNKISELHNGGPIMDIDTANFGIGLAGISEPDVNRDGIPDLWVGAYNQGSFYILILNAVGVPTTTTRFDSGTLGMDAGPYFDDGESMGDIGDDGNVELVIGHNGANCGYIVSVDTSSGLTVNLKIEAGTTPNFNPANDHSLSPSTLGRSAAYLGDVNGDGKPDVFLGDDGLSHNSAAGAGAGFVVFLDSLTAVQSYTPIASQGSHFAASNFAINLPSGERFGKTATGLGDINDDGVPDVAIGAYGHSAHKGAVYVLLLQSSGKVLTHNVIDTTDVNDHSATTPFMGHGLGAIPDMDGDGINEIIIGSFNDNSVRIARLNADGTVKGHTRVQVDEFDGEGAEFASIGNDARFGISATCLGDLDGDGGVDFAVGADNDDDTTGGRINTGSVLTFRTTWGNEAAE